VRLSLWVSLGIVGWYLRGGVGWTRLVGLVSLVVLDDVSWSYRTRNATMGRK
jgi:hypothetical protein